MLRDCQRRWYRFADDVLSLPHHSLVVSFSIVTVHFSIGSAVEPGSLLSLVYF